MARPQKEVRRERRTPELSPKKTRFGFDPTQLGVWLLILVPPFVFRTDSTDNFRLPKLLYTETLAALALAFLAFRLAKIDRIELAALGQRLRREPVLWAVLPLLLIAGLGALVAEHPERTTGAYASLGVACAFLVGLTLALAPRERESLLRLLCWPAAAIAVLGILQFHGLVQPFGFAQELTERLLLTSLAGGAFDLSAYLVLPAFFALRQLATADARRGRLIWGLLAALFVYGIAISQTLTVLLGFVAGSAILGFYCLRPYFWRIFGGLAATVVLLVLLVAPLRGRFEHARQAIADQDYNQLLSGRLDAWRVALRMLADHPWQGVGHGAYRSEFGDTKMTLTREGTEFFLGHRGAYFTNAHNELLEVGAELGWPGLLAALWAIFVVARQAWAQRRGSPPRVGLELGMLAAMLVISLGNFPFHVALIAYPWLIFLSGVLARDSAEEAAP